MRMRRAQHDRVGQPGKGDIVEIIAAPGQETRIFPTLGPVADHRAQHRHRNSLPNIELLSIPHIQAGPIRKIWLRLLLSCVQIGIR